MTGRGGQRAQNGFHRFPHVLSGVIKCPDDQILKGLHIAGIDHARVDTDSHDLSVTIEGDLHQATTGLTLRLGFGNLLLGHQQVLLHVLGLGQGGLQIA